MRQQDDSTHDFSKSLRVATKFLLDVMYGNDLPTPKWENFSFFSKIVPDEITRTGEIQIAKVNYQKLHRRVCFYGCKNTPMAVVFLEGREAINNGKIKLMFWRVANVHYIQNYDSSQISEPSDWIKMNVTGKQCPMS